MEILNYRELIQAKALDLDTMLYITNSIKAFQSVDPHFYDADSVFKGVFWGTNELFIINDNGFKACCITSLKTATSGVHYVDVISCIGEFAGKFKEYIAAVRDKVQQTYASDKPAFYKIEGRLGWAKNFKELGMAEMSSTHVGAFNYD